MKQIFTLFTFACIVCLQASAQISYSAASNQNAFLLTGAKETDAPFDKPSSSTEKNLYFNAISEAKMDDKNERNPFRLLSFRANKTENNKAVLEWFIDDNETLNYMEIEKSSNGKSFKAAALVFVSEKEGQELYKFKEGVTTKATYYRLRIINKKGTIGYSEVITLKK